MALFNNSNNSNTSTGSSALSSSSNTTSESTTGTAGASIEGVSTLEPEIPRLYVNSHEEEEDNKLELAEEEEEEEDKDENEDHEEYRNRSIRPFSSSSSSLTLSALSKTPFFTNSGNIIVDDESLRIPREPAYGDDNADGDDDGNEEDIEDGDEYDDDDDLYDQLFDLHDPISRKAALETASALFAQSHQSTQQQYSQLSSHYQSTLRRSNSTTSNRSIGAEDMDEVEKSFLRCTKPICSKKQLISCLSSRSTSPGPISPLLSDEDFGCISTATSSSTSTSISSSNNDGSVPPSLCSNSSTAPSSRRSSDGSHTPRVRFKKGCVITAVNLTWAPTTYDRAPIDVAESLDMHRCKNVEDAEGYAQDDEIVIHCDDDEQPRYLTEEQQQHTRGEWQAFAPGIYNASDLPVDLLPRAAASSTSPSTLSPSSAAATAMRMLPPPEDSPSSASDCQTSGFSFSRSTVGYPLSRQCFERSLSSSSSSSSSESENEDVIERCRGLRDLHHQLSSGSAALKAPSPSIYRPTARSPIRHSSIVSSTATVETSLGAAARELSDSLDESSRSSSPSLSRTASDDCLSSTPRAGNGSTFMSRRSAAAGQVGDQQHYFTSSIPSCVAARQANFDANGTHDTSPPPPEEQPARKVQRRLERRSSSACSVSRFPVSSDIWESCEALGGF